MKVKKRYAKYKPTYELQKIIDSLSFPKIFLIWILITIIFGCAYFFLSGPSTYLQVTQTGVAVNSFPQSVYFSFITATTTGFGDITPLGFFRVISIIEVVLGLLMIAVVTSKLVSLKQNVIIDELYELTFSERINRIRSSLLYSRQNINTIMHKVEDGLIRRREIESLYLSFISFQETLEEITLVFQKRSVKEFIQDIDAVHAGILANSILHSLQRIQELITSLNNQYLSWQTKKNIEYVGKIISLVNEVFSEISKRKVIPIDIFNNLLDEKDILVQSIEQLEEKLKKEK